jgi:hypothetical protein
MLIYQVALAESGSADLEARSSMSSGRNLGDRILRERSRTPLNRVKEEHLTWPFAKKMLTKKTTKPYSHRGGHWFDPSIAH